MRKITTIEQLKKLAARKQGVECTILLNFGLVSSKTIWFDKKFHVTHHIDGTEESLTVNQITKSNIGKALKQGALFY